VKLHRCGGMWVKIKAHPCWRVQSALDRAGVEYEVVKGPLSRGKRDDLERLSGQRQYPVIEFEDGSVYREESKDMAETIRAGRLDEKRGAAGATAPPAG
jgi:glutaredoxin